MKNPLGPQHSVNGVMPGHIVILWHQLKHEYVSDLKMYLEPILKADGRAYLRVSVCSLRFDEVVGGAADYLWASRDFLGMGYSITPAQLFDLLIVARDEIQRVFREGYPDGPPPLKEP